MMENLCIYESDVGNTALLCATEKQDYKGIWLKESLSSKCEFTQQISTVWWDRCVAVTSNPPPHGGDFPGGTSGKELACQCRRYKRCGFDPWVRKILWRRAWQPTPLLLPGESHGQRSRAGYSPQGPTELDTTEATWHARRTPLTYKR